MDLRLYKHGLKIKNSNISIELGKDDLIDLLYELKKDDYWGEILKRVVNSEKGTYVGAGGCKFPVSCEMWFKCVKKYCNVDVCSNGRVYKLS